MFRDKYFRVWNGPYPFKNSDVSKAPTSPGVYQILYQDSVAYIGISTTSIRDRLVKHVKGHGNWAAARRTSTVGYQFVYFLSDPLTARQIESHVISNSKPAFNVKAEYKHYIDSITVH